METCIVGFGSVMLAFQPNTNLIQGKFLPKVLKKALPNSIVFILVTSIVYLIAMSFIPVEQAQLETIAALTYTVAVFYALVFNCKPFNLYRIIVLVLSAVSTLIGIFSLGWFFGYVSLSNVELLILICVAQFAYPAMTLLTKLFNKLEIK